MILFLKLVLTVVFLILSVIHFNWSFGGKYGFEKALPTKEDGTRVLNPKKFDSAIIGIVLLFFAVYYLIKANILLVDLPNWMLNYIGWIISSIFIVRAIGDFKYAGFFKKIKNTVFGIADTKHFSPLCIFVGIIGLIIELYQ